MFAIINQNGIDEYFKRQDAREKELLLHLDKKICQVEDILYTIICIMDQNRDNHKDKVSEIVYRAIKPMISECLNKDINTLGKK